MFFLSFSVSCDGDACVLLRSAVRGRASMFARPERRSMPVKTRAKSMMCELSYVWMPCRHVLNVKTDALNALNV